MKLKEILSYSAGNRAVESDQLFDLKLVRGGVLFLEALKKACDDLVSNPAKEMGAREFGHNHGFGAAELAYDFYHDVLNEELIGMHRPKSIVVCDCVEDENEQIAPLARVPFEELDRGATLKGTLVLNSFLPWLISMGTKSVDVEIGIKSCGEPFEVIFSPTGINTKSASDWISVNGASSSSLTWLSVAVNVEPYRLIETPIYSAANYTGAKYDLNVWAIRITERKNIGTTEEGFFTDVHQTDLHRLDAMNIPGVETP